MPKVDFAAVLQQVKEEQSKAGARAVGVKSEWRRQLEEGLKEFVEWARQNPEAPELLPLTTTVKQILKQIGVEKKANQISQIARQAAEALKLNVVKGADNRTYIKVR